MKNTDIYQAITDKILAAMEQGVLPWRRPFNCSVSPVPVNLTTGRPYRGINLFLLNLAAWQLEYPKNVWLTFNQARKLGGHIKKGEASQLVVFWKSHTIIEEAKNQEPVEKIVRVARTYHVFNVGQCEGISKTNHLAQAAPLGSAAEIYAAYPETKPEVLVGTKALYLPTRDQVRIPDIAHFETPAGYYATLFHELIHSTGHQIRLDREGITQVGSTGEIGYAREELVAEMGAAFLCALTEIQTPELTGNSAAYLQSWLEVFKQDKTMIVKAASQAQRAVDYILGEPS